MSWCPKCQQGNIIVTLTFEDRHYDDYFGGGAGGIHPEDYDYGTFKCEGCGAEWESHHAIESEQNEFEERERSRCACCGHVPGD